MTQPLRALWPSLTALACVASAPFAVAEEGVQFSVHSGFGYSDNVLRVPSAQAEDTIGEVGVGLSIDHKSRRLDVDALGEFVYQDYLKGTFDSEFTGSFHGLSKLRIDPDHFTWSVEDSFGQTRQDLAAGITPLNRENINYLTTGPNFFFRLGGNNLVELGAQYQRIDYEKSPLDSQRYAGSLAFSHEMSKSNTLGVHVQAERTDYVDLADTADNDREAAFLRYVRRDPRGSLTFDVGANRITTDLSSKTGPLARLSFLREVTGRSSLWVEVARELTDAGASGATIIRNPTDDPNDQSLSQTSDPFTSDYVMVGWRIQGRRTAVELAASRALETYVGISAKRTRDQYVAEVERQLAADWTAAFAGRYDRNEFDGLSADFAETSLSVSMSKRMSRRFYLDGSYEYFRRGSDLVGSEYTENRIWLRLRFGAVSVVRFGPPGARTSPEL